MVIFQLLLQTSTKTVLMQDGCFKGSQYFLKLCVSCLSQRCVLGRHLRESPGDKAKLQQASWSLLQGITHLVELGEECITEGQTSQVHSRGRLQAVLCRREVFHRAFNKFSCTLAKIYDGHFPNSVEQPLDGFQGRIQRLNNLKQLMITCLCYYLCASFI